MLFEIYMALENPGMSAFWDEVSPRATAFNRMFC